MNFPQINRPAQLANRRIFTVDNRFCAKTVMVRNLFWYDMRQPRIWAILNKNFSKNFNPAGGSSRFLVIDEQLFFYFFRLKKTDLEQIWAEKTDLEHFFNNCSISAILSRKKRFRTELQILKKIAELSWAELAKTFPWAERAELGKKLAELSWAELGALPKTLSWAELLSWVP
jgi:hypothetical protein